MTRSDFMANMYFLRVARATRNTIIARFRFTRRARGAYTNNTEIACTKHTQRRNYQSLMPQRVLYVILCRMMPLHELLVMDCDPILNSNGLSISEKV